MYGLAEINMQNCLTPNLTKLFQVLAGIVVFEPVFSTQDMLAQLWAGCTSYTVRTVPICRVWHENAHVTTNWLAYNDHIIFICWHILPTKQ